MPTRDSLWWQKKKPDERASALCGVIDSLQSYQDSRKRRILRNLRLFEGRALAELNPESYFTDLNYAGEDYGTYRVNLARALVSTAKAKIAGKQRPKAQFCVTDGDWSVKRKAKKRERFVEAAMLSRQGLLSDGHEVGLQAFGDACAADIGVLKFWPDLQNERVAIDRVLPWEFMVDPNEASRGQPQNFFHSYGYDRFKLCERFPKYEAEIMAAPSVNDVGFERRGGTLRESRLVRVDEGWRLAMSKKKPGVHTIAVGGKDLTDGEEWTRDYPPFLFILWEPQIVGIYGTSLVEIAAPLCEELNAAFERWAKAERLGSNAFIPFEEGTIKPEVLASNEPFIGIPFQKGAQPPTVITPQTMGEASIRWMEVVKALGYEIPGISQMAATGQKEPGVTAAVAMRTIENIGSERFAIQWQQYERIMSVGAARQILACVKDMVDQGVDVMMRLAVGGVLEELRAKDLMDWDMPDESIQVYAVSGLVNTPADRLDLAEKLFTMGILSQDGFLRVIQAKDIDSELSRNNQQSALLERYIEQWLDATEADEKSGKFRYRPPIKWMNLEEAIVQVGRAYMQAELDDCPEYNLQFFLRFLTQTDREIQNRAAAQAQLQRAPPAAGPPAPAIPPQAVAPQMGAAA